MKFITKVEVATLKLRDWVGMILKGQQKRDIIAEHMWKDYQESIASREEEEESEKNKTKQNNSGIHVYMDVK